LIEDNASGVYNATGPDTELMMGEILDACNGCRAVWQPSTGRARNFWQEHGVQPWSDMPVWIPDTEEDAGFSRMDVSRAIDAGLKFRPLEDTIRDTIAWAETRPETTSGAPA
jgi:2'-hydroxyisoflavone reductase